MDALETPLGEPSHNLMEEVCSWEAITNDEDTPFKNVPTLQLSVVTVCSVSKMAAGVLRDRALSIPTESMDDQTDVEMAREVPGLTMST